MHRILLINEVSTRPALPALPREAPEGLLGAGVGPRPRRAPAPARGEARCRIEGRVRVFSLEADPKALARLCPPELSIVQGYGSRVLIFLCESSLLGGAGRSMELVAAMAVTEPGTSRAPGLFVFAHFAEADEALSAARARFGFAPRKGSFIKRAGAVELRDEAGLPQLSLSWRVKRGGADGAAVVALLDSFGGVSLYQRAPSAQGRERAPLRSMLCELSVGPSAQGEAFVEATPLSGPFSLLLPRAQRTRAHEFCAGYTLDSVAELSLKAGRGATAAALMASGPMLLRA